MAKYFITLCIVLCIFSLLKSNYYFLIGIIIWFIFQNLSTAVYSANTGGDYLLNQLLLFLCFIPSTSKIIFTETKTAIYNFGVLAIFAQIFLVYLLSGYSKVIDTDWASGTAIIQISKCNHYSLFQINNLLLSQILCYVIMVYQLTFPIIIWLKPVKKFILFIGILMHFYIALIMGLVSFGLIMIICYTLFTEIKLPLSKK